MTNCVAEKFVKFLTFHTRLFLHILTQSSMSEKLKFTNTITAGMHLLLATIYANLHIHKNVL